MGAAACPPHRLSSAFRAGSHPGLRAAFSVTVARFELDARHQPGWLPALRFGSGGPHAHLRGLRSRNPRAAGAATAPWPGLRGLRLPRRCVGPLGRALLRVSTAPAGAARCPLGSGSNPSPRPSQGRERVALCRQRCQAFNGQAPHTASVGWRAIASKPSPSGGLTASLDPAARRRLSGTPRHACTQVAAASEYALNFVKSFTATRPASTSTMTFLHLHATECFGMDGSVSPHNKHS